MYNEILGHEQERPELPSIDPLFSDVWNEFAVESFIYDWNSKIICQSLKETQELLGSEERLWMVRGCFAQRVEGPTKTYGPDWAEIRTYKGTNQNKNDSHCLKRSILPGDTKISTTWNFHKGVDDGTIREGSTKFAFHSRPAWFKPLVQIFTYCYRLQARYGYLITDKELLAVRIGPCPDSPRTNGPISRGLELDQTRKNGLLEFASVQWAHNGSQDMKVVTSSAGEEGHLSVNLALWWLHLLAAKDNTLQWEYGPLVQERLPNLNEGPDDSGVVFGHDSTSQRSMSVVDNNSAVRESMSSLDDRPTYSFDGGESQIPPSSTEVEVICNSNKSEHKARKRPREGAEGGRPDRTKKQR